MGQERGIALDEDEIMSPEDWVGRIRRFDSGDGWVMLVNQFEPDDINIEARLQSDGVLEIYRQCLWRGTDGQNESETWTRVAAEDIPRAVEVLGGEPGTDILEVLAEKWTFDNAARAIRSKLEEAGITVEFFCWP